MKTTNTLIATMFILGACASTPDDGVKQNRMRDCPLGMVQICETRERDPSKGGDEEIREYEFCRCELLPN